MNYAAWGAQERLGEGALNGARVLRDGIQSEGTGMVNGPGKEKRSDFQDQMQKVKLKRKRGERT